MAAKQIKTHRKRVPLELCGGGDGGVSALRECDRRCSSIGRVCSAGAKKQVRNVSIRTDPPTFCY